MVEFRECGFRALAQNGLGAKSLKCSRLGSRLATSTGSTSPSRTDQEVGFRGSGVQRLKKLSTLDPT